ncbi:MBL fold metallo-hydrolase [Roseovarius faecimaris]|uniref:MBL fold metallo-hydrolase n=1 Tax=Roseovarius faecimaris TaxID=2494550 RepID=A0A6I6ISS4_9RHOB|nr:MBL fold metallo-hydrolase [Roseovarius faecimaris]QGX99252.1 MBL fold metallo-hydrolase [Roseovarius faecimaris]
MPAPFFNRRTLLASAAALPLAPLAARASAPMLGVDTPPHRRVKLGAFEVTTLLAGAAVRPEPQTIFGMNASAEDFAALSAEANIPTDQAQFFFTPTVVNTGSELVLFDTGLNAEGTGAALEAAGYSTDMIDLVVITHMHGDHIGGLMNGSAPTFGNARYATGRVEFDAWAGMENERFEANMRPVAEMTTMIEDGASAFSGHTAMAAFGHTPGHMVHLIESEGQSLLIAADFANHYVWSLERPDWEVKFDMDKAAAAATRRRLLDMMATDRLPFVGYHMPWPGIGYVERSGDSYRYAPMSYQLML